MNKFGEIFYEKRKKKRISLDKVSKDLLIKKEHLEALENEQWQNLPEPAFVKGYIKTYAEYLKLDLEYILAVYRREFDARKYPIENKSLKREKRLFVTPTRLVNLSFIMAIVAFVLYIVLQYSSILSAPKLEVFTPKNDETTSIPVIEISGKTETEATVSVDGTFVPIDEVGTFTYQYILKDGRNTIEIIASKRLSPKAKSTKTVRLIR